MALDVESIVDGGVSGEKSLRRSGRLEPLHSPFALPNRKVRILRLVVASPAGDVFAIHAEISQKNPVGWEFVGHHLVGRSALLLEQRAHQLERDLLVSAALNQDIENLPLPVYCSPQIHPCADDENRHFVQLPTPIRSGT